MLSAALRFDARSRDKDARDPTQQAKQTHVHHPHGGNALGEVLGQHVESGPQARCIQVLQLQACIQNKAAA